MIHLSSDNERGPGMNAGSFHVPPSVLLMLRQ
jgi:hypothetical protein